MRPSSRSRRSIAGVSPCSNRRCSSGDRQKDRTRTAHFLSGFPRNQPSATSMMPREPERHRRSVLRARLAGSAGRFIQLSFYTGRRRSGRILRLRWELRSPQAAGSTAQRAGPLPSRSARKRTRARPHAGRDSDLGNGLPWPCRAVPRQARGEHPTAAMHIGDDRDDDDQLDEREAACPETRALCACSVECGDDHQSTGLDYSATRAGAALEDDRTSADILQNTHERGAGTSWGAAR